MFPDFEDPDIRKPVIWSLIQAALKLVAQADKEHREGRDIRYLPPALEHLACMMRKHMSYPNERLDTMRNNFVRSDPYYCDAMEKLGFSAPRWERQPEPPIPWQHDWREEDFDDDETEEETSETAPKKEDK